MGSSTRARLAVTWDYDSAQGQVAASYPYHYRVTPLRQELDAVDELIELGRRLATPMTFATVGFAAEEVPDPFDGRERIRALYAEGHEIASHSWRHEWLPHLNNQQLKRSLLRSKLALEQAIGTVGAVRGMVPPFDRPMTWWRHLQVRPGDRWAFPFGAGACTDTLLRAVAAAGYEWMRVTLLARPWRNDPLEPPFREGGCIAAPFHHPGFDEQAHRLLDRAIDQGRLFTITAHPAGLFRHDEESRKLVVAFMERAAAERDAGRLDVVTMSDGIGLPPLAPAPAPTAPTEDGGR